MRPSSGCVLLLAIIIFSSSTLHSYAVDTLYSEQPLPDGRTLTSVNGNFELGFFSPAHSTNRYVGIWYMTNLIPDRTVIWVANRQDPIIRSSGLLMINGSLMILDLIGDTLYLLNPFGSSKFVSAKLLDNGNFVLRDGKKNSVLWQSFDYPTDTIVPGMKMGQDRFLTSWLSPASPTKGRFTWGLDPDGEAEFILSESKHTYWKSGVWDGQGFGLVLPEMGSNALFNYSYVANGSQRFFSYNVADKSAITRIVMDFSGIIQQLVWSEQSKKWDVSWSRPKNLCEVNSTCGAFGTCNGDSKSSPVCKCLKGFEPTSAMDWDKGIWSGGCKRRNNLSTCGRYSSVNGGSDQFFSASCTKLPSDPNHIAAAQNATECERTCLSNCNCTAYSSSNGCLIWYGNLLNLQQSSPSDRRTDILYLRLAHSDPKRGKMWLWALAALRVVIASLFLGTILWFARRGKMKQKAGRNDKSEDQVDSDQPPPKVSSNGKLNYKGKNAALPLYSFGSIVAATNNFSSANKLGQGGFGPVYKANWGKGQVVAVKRLSRSSGQGLEEFKNEVILIAKLQHINLIRLLGCCIEGEEKILLYEFMPNKSLDSFIFDSRKKKLLDWRKRLQIIDGIAHGLLYLHNYSRVKIIHRDIKASNILLDRKLVPKIADFGMARIFGRKESQANTKRIVGTYGYMPPEYAIGGIYSEKSDVFSFGVLLLEIVSGQRNTGFYNCELGLTLLGYAWELWKHCRALEMLDPELGTSPPKNEVTRCIHVGLLCVQSNALDRPTMTDTVAMLSNEAASLPTPREPAFALRQSEQSDVNEVVICSNNEVTLSVMEPR